MEGGGLAWLFPDGVGGFHDGASVPVPLALELLRGMLREHGASCRLEAQAQANADADSVGAFAVHVGWDQYVPCPAAVARTR
ncbi:hypothetical protein OTB20_07170 [Streptomyces sp. H27-H1]|uniref:hypothetical protein n=1 Tax=Streptomyces sp. H27-H1 TaxID=2996461 RepID=UPI00226F71FD|nr:hypothetical protein [Streptomyces sp. H27-H1]MCY0925992.1 hypothetical protein [Streptomyces sp. H27-H1]